MNAGRAFYKAIFFLAYNLLYCEPIIHYETPTLPHSLLYTV